MTIDELINTLQAVRDAEGDIEVKAAMETSELTFQIRPISGLRLDSQTRMGGRARKALWVVARWPI